MAVLVTPSFYETNFSGSEPDEKRAIAKRFIYVIKEFDKKDKPLKYWAFFTSDEGKLRIWNAEKKSWKPVPIYPGTYHFYVTDSNTPIKDPNLNLHKEMCGKPITVTNDKEQKIEIAYKDGDLYFTIYYQVGDDAFKKAAETWRKEKGLNNICTTTVCYLGIEVKTEPQFKKAWLDIYTKALAGHYRVMEGRLFTHASIHKNRDGLEFAGDPADPAADDPTSGETTLEKVEISNLEKLPWDRTGLLGLHGCNTGIERNGWSPAKTFCNSQKVRTFGQMGYAFFSENKDKFTDLI
jgi:hypothetical protein